MARYCQAIHGHQAIHGWPGPSADGLGPHMAPNSPVASSNSYAAQGRSTTVSDVFLLSRAHPIFAVGMGGLSCDSSSSSASFSPRTTPSRPGYRMCWQPVFRIKASPNSLPFPLPWAGSTFPGPRGACEIPRAWRAALGAAAGRCCCRLRDLDSLDGVRSRELGGSESELEEAMVRVREGGGKILKRPKRRVG